MKLFKKAKRVDVGVDDSLSANIYVQTNGGKSEGGVNGGEINEGSEDYSSAHSNPSPV